MVELLAAMTILSIGLLAVFTMLESGMLQIRRASTLTTAGVLADAELEGYRAIRYDAIGLLSAEIATADSTYTGDSAYRAVSSPENQASSAVTVSSTSNDPTKTVTGADGRSYRVDTYISWQSVSVGSTSGRDVKLVTVVVRGPAGQSTVWARASSSFDQSTGR